MKLYNHFYFAMDSDFLTQGDLLLILQEASTEAFGITCRIRIYISHISESKNFQSDSACMAFIEIVYILLMKGK